MPTRPETRPTRLVFFTSSDEDEARALAERCQADGYLLKSTRNLSGSWSRSMETRYLLVQGLQAPPPAQQSGHLRRLARCGTWSMVATRARCRGSTSNARS
ncbi:MAG: hypothetical protein R3F62_10295 [Planctomycetota bacterium]